MEEEKPKYAWKARFAIAIAMLVFALVGLIVTNVSKEFAWNYWRVMVPMFAVFSIWLGWYLRYKKQKVTTVTIWHEVLHWLGLLAAVYLVSVFVGIGLMSRYNAALVILTLLALTTYIAGIYTDITFMPIGILLGLFVAGAAMTEVYLYSIMIPVTIIVAVIVWFLIHRRKKTSL